MRLLRNIISSDFSSMDITTANKPESRRREHNVNENYI